MNARTMGLLSVPALAWATLLFSPAPAMAQFGTIKGKLVYGGDKAPESAVIVKKGDSNVKDAAVCAADNLKSRDMVVDPKTKGIQYGIAFLKTVTGKNPDAEKALVAKAPEVIIDQKNCEFLPYVTPVFTGQKTVFKSSDPVGHNVRYTGFRNPAKNVMLPPNGQLEEKLQAERLPIELKCDIHDWMKAWVFPLDHPFFAVTKEDGSFEIAGVPAGSQVLILWQEKVGYANPEGTKGIMVTVKAGETTDIGEVKLDPAKIKK